MTKPVRKAVIPAAGWGTGLLPMSKAVPKELMPVYDRPVIQHVVEEAVAAGIDQILIVTRRGKSALVDHFDRDHELESLLDARKQPELLAALISILPDHVSMNSVRQTHAAGLGDAVLCAQAFVGDEPFAVLLPDMMFPSGPAGMDLSALIAEWQSTHRAQLLLAEVPREDLHRYGVADFEFERQPARGRGGPLTKLVEKPVPGSAPSNLAVMGRYILPASVFQALEETPHGKHGEIQLTDALMRLCQAEGVYGYVGKGEIVDCGNRSGLLQATLIRAMEDEGLSDQLHERMTQLLSARQEKRHAH